MEFGMDFGKILKPLTMELPKKILVPLNIHMSVVTSE